MTAARREHLERVHAVFGDVPERWEVWQHDGSSYVVRLQGEAVCGAAPWNLADPRGDILRQFPCADARARALGQDLAQRAEEFSVWATYVPTAHDQTLDKKSGPRSKVRDREKAAL